VKAGGAVVLLLKVVFMPLPKLDLIDAISYYEED